MFAWVQRCPKCGYCASDVSSLKEGAKMVVMRMEYKRQLKDPTYPELANSFLCKAIIDHESKDYVAATWAFVRASWACDDSHLGSQAKACREKAVDMIAIAEEQGQRVSEQEGARTAILTDLLRRVGRFDQARQVIEKERGSISDDNFKRILDFQIGLIEKQDMSCHNIEEALEENEAAIITETQVVTSTDEEGKIAIQEELHPEQTKYSAKKRESKKLIADVNFILRSYEKQYRIRSDEWHKNVFMKPDYEYDDIEYNYYGNANSPLSMTLRNILYLLLESECGTHCKAEDILDSLYHRKPSLFWSKINYMPSMRKQLCYSELLGWCLDEDNLDKLLRELIDHIERCHDQCKAVFFLTSQWNPEVYSIYADKIETFKKRGVHITFILFTFTTLRATEISTNATTFIKRNILGLRRILARFCYSLNWRNL
jgi:hypothetical protein